MSLLINAYRIRCAELIITFCFALCKIDGAKAKEKIWTSQLVVILDY